jgi:1-deoxy-D-xylulose-5-phosphate synthase
MPHLLNHISLPTDLRLIGRNELKFLCEELRAEVISTVAQTGGHLGASLGVVELTVALHYVFNTPHDLIVWDIGHQSYPHKILTGRKDRMHSLRKPGGLSGFTKRTESNYDCWGAGHCSTSISAAIGMATGLKHNNEDKKVIAVIGDGALSAGMAYEALNNAACLDHNLIIILNDNEMSISPAVGAMSKYLTKLFFSKPLLKARIFAKKSLNLLPHNLANAMRHAFRKTKSTMLGGNFFEELGMIYIGPLDGHNIEDLVSILTKIKNDIKGKPIVMHVKTEKGKGFASTDETGEKYHAVNTFDILTKKPMTLGTVNPSYSKIFGTTLTNLAHKDKQIVAITAAMPSGTGLSIFAKTHPERFYDVGIAEQHAVTFAAGLACQGLKPFVAIYSTFLQRAYDQVVHDVAIQNLPVRFIIDRAGLVGPDGATHAGSFDIAYLAAVPNMVIMSPSCDQELVNMIATAAHYDLGPIALRFPRKSSMHNEIPLVQKIIEIGQANIISHGNNGIAILSLGNRLDAALQANTILAQRGINLTIVDMRFAKPIDHKLLSELAQNHQLFITIEEGSIGGMSAQVFDYMQQAHINHVSLKSLYFKDEFLDQGIYDTMNQLAGVGTDDLIKVVIEFLTHINSTNSPAKALEFA